MDGSRSNVNGSRQTDRVLQRYDSNSVRHVLTARPCPRSPRLARLLGHCLATTRLPSGYGRSLEVSLEVRTKHKWVRVPGCCCRRSLFSPLRTCRKRSSLRSSGFLGGLPSIAGCTAANGCQIPKIGRCLIGTVDQSTEQQEEELRRANARKFSVRWLPVPAPSNPV